jgi:hypothetical protein
MTREELDALLAREPFVPFRMYVRPGKVFEVPFADVVRTQSRQAIVFIGMKQGTRQAKSFDSFPFDYIERIEERPSRGRGKRRKAS